ncbi:hypothetical protein Scep_006013 [Stephania cephalantha]|uniref:Uncharacterized protein n=1 Tax=Stephania cephalantha TaxID=152367 RepID=A0AAP0K772_9MAGN
MNETKCYTKVYTSLPCMCKYTFLRYYCLPHGKAHLFYGLCYALFDEKWSVLYGEAL